MCVAEFLGSALLALVVIGSGAAAQQLSPHDIGLELLENAAATGVGLYALILIFRPASGAHFNPIVSLSDWLIGDATWRRALCYLPAQIGGCIGGALLANSMFSLPFGHLSVHARLNSAHFISEVVATAGLVIVIFALSRSGSSAAVPAAVGCYIAGAYFFTSSTSFANPAITVGRIFTTSFAGIAPGSVVGFIGAQLIGGVIGMLTVITIYPRRAPLSEHVP
jgi:glycerol uptake facilitator-like aquaporin